MNPARCKECSAEHFRTTAAKIETERPLRSFPRRSRDTRPLRDSKSLSAVDWSYISEKIISLKNIKIQLNPHAVGKLSLILLSLSYFLEIILQSTIPTAWRSSLI